MMDRLTEDVGVYNASTWDDFTNYYEVIPSNYLKPHLGEPSVSNLTVDEANFVQSALRPGGICQEYWRSPTGCL